MPHEKSTYNSNPALRALTWGLLTGHPSKVIGCRYIFSLLPHYGDLTVILKISKCYVYAML